MNTIENEGKNYKICGITTRALTMSSFMIDNLAYLSNYGFNAYIICESDSEIEKKSRKKVTYIPLDMNHGNVSIKEVINCTKALYRIFKQEKFDEIQYASSNAGLYASVAGFLAHVPVRIFCQWGLTYLGFFGFKRWFYKMAEKLTCFLSTSVQPDSHTNLMFAISEHLFPLAKGEVIWNGSACGIDLARFDISKKSEWRKFIRNKYNIPDDCKLLGFVGRVVRDKGINELLGSFEKLNDNFVKLMIVGPRDDLKNIDVELYENSLNDNRIIYTDSVHDTEKYYASFDYLILPSYREGFGMVLLEAAAMGVPSIISDIQGPKDLIQDGYNGFICNVKSTESLLAAIKKALSVKDEQYSKLSLNSYKEAKTKYDNNLYKIEFLKNRTSLLNK